MEILTQRIENLIFKFSLQIDKGKWEHMHLHLDYEDGKYRQFEIKNIVRDALPHFALTQTEYDEYTASGDDGEKMRLAWSRISKRHKYSKGDYGELLLFLVLKVFYKSEKLVTKVKLKTGNQEVYGYDCAHFTIEDDEPILWLGESKFYNSFSNALTKAFESLEEHCKVTYTKNEFSFLEPHIEINKNFPHYKDIRNKLKLIQSFDEIKIKVPIFITYDCDKIQNHKNSKSKEFIDEFKKEFEEKKEAIEKRVLKLKPNFELIFILLPFETVSDIKDQIDLLEKANR